MITIVNLIWGKWPGRKWLWTYHLQRTYLRNFRNAVQKNYSGTFKHVVFTDRPGTFATSYFRSQENMVFKQMDGAEKWRGCMPKLIAFKEDPDLVGQVFVFDLDNVITGNIDKILSYDGEFAICSDPLPRRKGLIGGNLSAFPAGSLASIYHQVAADYSKFAEICQGSERFLLDHLLASGDLPSCEFLQDLYPGQIQSLKFDLKFESDPPEGMSVLWLHGRPRPHLLKRKGYSKYQDLWQRP